MANMDRVRGLVSRALSRAAGLALVTLAWVMVAAQASAQCVTAETVTTGVAFTLSDGQVGTVKRSDDGLIDVLYRSANRDASDRRLLRLGLYPVENRYSSAPQGVIGIWSNSRFEIGYTGRFPEPVPGRSWETNLRFVTSTSDHTGIERIYRGRGTGIYRFLEARQVELGGCTYRMIPVEATITGDIRGEMARTAYFPDLGYGIETQVTDLITGTVTTHGITAMRPAS